MDAAQPLPNFTVCPSCKRELTAHRWVTPDGHVLETCHCRDHGDVVPMRSAVRNEYLEPRRKTHEPHSHRETGFIPP